MKQKQATMSKLWTDNPLATSMIFFPRRAARNSGRMVNVEDGVFTVAEGIKVGYRLYWRLNSKALIVCFHGNAECAADSDYVAALMRHIGVSLLVVDYRGYGWSDGHPRASIILEDAVTIWQQLNDHLAPHGLATLPRYLLGRSLGSASAIHIATLYPQTIQGLIIESGFAHAPLVLSALGLPRALLRCVPPIFGNWQTIRRYKKPLLIIHGERDTVIAIEQGQLLYDAAGSDDKRFVRVPHVGHNDLTTKAATTYCEAIAAFVEQQHQS